MDAQSILESQALLTQHWTTELSICRAFARFNSVSDEPCSQKGSTKGILQQCACMYSKHEDSNPKQIRLTLMPLKRQVFLAMRRCALQHASEGVCAALPQSYLHGSETPFPCIDP